MATTTNYAWETPDDTDLVKDGAAAIRTLGSSIDTTTKALNPSTTLGDIEYRSSTANTNTRLGIGSTGQVLTVAGGVPSWASPATTASGLNLVSTTTIGTAVSTVTVSDAFSATYDNYLIQISGGVASINEVNGLLRLGSTTTDYLQSGFYQAYNSSTITGQTYSISGFVATAASTVGHYGIINLQDPFASRRTTFSSILNSVETGNGSSRYAGFLNNTTSYTAFTLSFGNANVTGGTIRVYGYKNS